MWNVKNKINIGEGNGNSLWCSCLENPRDGGASWAAIYGVVQSWTRLKRLSSSSRAILRWGNKKKSIFTMFLFNVFLSGKKNEMNKFYNKATYFSLWTKRCAGLKWNKEGTGSDTRLLSNTGQWPLRGETNNLSPEVIPTLLPRVSRWYLRKKYIIFIYIGMKSPITFLGEKMGLGFPGSKAATLYLKRVE